MKFFVLLLVIITTVAVIADQEDDWTAFKIKFGKLFLSKSKEAKRKAAFFKNKAHLEHLQAKYEAGHISYKPQMYEHHDLEPEEMSRFMNGNSEIVHEEEEHSEMFKEIPLTRQSLPTNYSSVPFLNKIKSQKTCGACWAFSAVSAIEGSLKYKTNISVDLSEQFLVDCVYPPDYDGCQGGAPTKAINWLRDNGGAVEQVEYPYMAAWGTCNMTKPRKVAVFNKTQVVNQADILKNAVMQFGSLIILANATEWVNYGSGIFQASSIEGVNHGVNLVGWGFDPTVQRPYWLVRNQWGKWWGENGYIRLAADVGDLCSWTTKLTYAVYLPDNPML